MALETPELIESQIQETRQSMTDKIAAIEESVKQTVQQTTSAVSDTMDKVKDSVRGVFDVTPSIRENPWTALAISAGVGLLTGMLLPRRNGSPSVLPQPMVSAPIAAPTLVPRAVVQPPEPRTPNVLDQLLARAGDELKKLGEAAIDRVATELQRAVDDGVPKLVDRLPFTKAA